MPERAGCRGLAHAVAGPSASKVPRRRRATASAPASPVRGWATDRRSEDRRGASDNAVVSNIVAFNLGEGISVDPGSGNTVLDNLLVENGDQG